MIRNRSLLLLSFRSRGVLLVLSMGLLVLQGLTSAAQTSVYAWGDNYNGELGNGTSGNIGTTPMQTNGLTDAVRIAGGFNHSLAVKSDGTVWAYGGNGFGQLGNGANLDSSVPIQVHGPIGVDYLTGIIAVAGGDGHSLALKSDSTVWAWGNNGFGQLGNGTSDNSRVPVQTINLMSVVAISCGGDHSLALKSDGTVWAWGDNDYGQLGNGTFTISRVPVPVGGLTGVIAVAGGGYHSLALKSDGTVWTWGDNEVGQLGNGMSGFFSSSDLPVQVHNPNGVGYLTGVVAIAAGRYHNLALKSDGTVLAWGDNISGQLGDGSTLERTLPVPVRNLTDVLKVASGGNHNLALKPDGTAWAWGDNQCGELGDGTTTNSAVPVQTSGLANVVAIAVGSSHCLAFVALTATVSGTITLQGCVNPVQSITFQFRPTDGSTPITRTTTLDVTGAFHLPAVPRNSYTLWIKGAKWLAKVVAVDTSAGDVSGVTATLLAGDANNDNAITTADYLLLKASFGSMPGDPNWNNGMADFNCDGIVSTADYLLLKQNFGQTGDS